MTRLALRFLCLCLLVPACHAATNAEAGVDKLFARWDWPDSPGAAVVIVNDGKVIHQRGYGSANLETRTPITPQTVFDVASVAKQFAGLAVARLVEQGKLSLDDEVRKHLPDVPDFGKPITIRHLVYHTSGLRDWPETLALSGLDWAAVITLPTILEMVQRQRELDFTPGEEYQYSNTGYNLLAAAVAKVTGQSFPAWSETNIFKPLEMNATHVCEDPTKVIPNRAESYMPAGEKKFSRALSQLAAAGSSSLFISAEDMGKWLLRFGGASSAGSFGEAFERMQAPGTLSNGKAVDYGFGVGLGDFQGTKKISHTGGWAGYRSIVFLLPEKKFGLAILSNAGNLNTSELARKIAALYLGDSLVAKPAKPADAQVKPSLVDRAQRAPKLNVPQLTRAQLEAYCGDYWSEELRVMHRIEIRDGALGVRQRSGAWVKLLPTGADRFDTEQGGGTVEFTRNGASEPTELKVSGGRIRNVRFVRNPLAHWPEP